MKSRFWFTLTALVILAFAATACGSATPTPRPTPTNAPPTLAPTQPPPTATATQPSTATPTQTSIPVQATAKQDVNTRKGPGLEYAIAQKMTKGTQASVVGKNTDGKWLQIAFPDATNASWVSATFLTVTGPADTLQVVEVAPVPTATRGAVAPTKAVAATSTVAVPAPSGGMGFVDYDSNRRVFNIAFLSVESHATSDFKQIGSGSREGGGPFDVRNSTSMPPFAWSPDGLWLAYVVSPDGQSDFLRLTNRNGDVDNPLYGHKCITSASWVDNKTIAYIGMDDLNCTTQRIYKIGKDSTFPSDRNFFTAQSESLRGLAWGPFVLYVSNKSGAQEIWRLNGDVAANPSGGVQITSDGRENGSPSWSPDGTKFAYYSKQTDGTYQIMVRNADGSNPRKLTSTGHNFSPTWSPDGNWIAFMSDRGGRADVYIMNRNGGQVQLLTDKSAVGGLLPGSWR